ncbi:MAG: putative arabinose efflux permease, family [Hyphomicrobiales bacterium]|nr:putative arabinose efflux permease, family [Hyphomicrobiales bacterium]
MILFIISLCGLASTVAYRSMDPLVTAVARDFMVPVTSAALLSSFYALPFALGQPILGPLGDVFGKGRVLIICLWVLTGTLIVGAFSPSFEALLGMRFIGGLAGGGTMPVAMALIGDRFPPNERQLAIARFLSVTLIGQVFASSLAGLLAVSVGWRGFFLLSAAVAFTAALGATWKLREPKTVERPRFSIGGALGRYRLVFANPKSWLCFGTVFIEAIAIYGATPYVGEILEQAKLGGPREAGFVIAGIGIGGLLYSFALTVLMKRLSRIQMMASGGVIGAVAIAGAAFIPGWPVLVALFTMLGFGFVMLHNSVQTEVASLAPEARASAFSMHAFSFFLGQAIGPIVFGNGMHLIGTGPMLAINACVLAAVGLGAAALFSRHSSVLD